MTDITIIGPSGDTDVEGPSGAAGPVAVAADSQIIGWALSQAYGVRSATRDSNNAVTLANIVWPDGAQGVLTADLVSTAFPGALDAYHVTYVVGDTTKTITQAAVTRNADGGVTAQPDLTIA